MKGMTPKQISWWTAKKATMEAISNAWQYDRKLAYELFTEKFRTDINTACERLGINLAKAWDEDGWDGEEDANILTTGRQLTAIRMKLAGEKIPEFWFISAEQEMENRHPRRR